MERPMLPPGTGQPHGRNNKYDKYGDQSELEAQIERDAKLLYQGKRLAKVEGFTGYFEFMANDFPPKSFTRATYIPTFLRLQRGPGIINLRKGFERVRANPD